MSGFTIDGRRIGPEEPTYFIADIAANHDGSLDRARALIGLAADAGADAAKFQHFTADKIVSQHGFDRMSGQVSHQATWSKPVVEVYRDASIPPHWTAALRAECDHVGITFFSSPYDAAAVDELDPYVPAFKVGSGDIDWLEHLGHVASRGKPVILGTGAATLEEVSRAVEHVSSFTDELAILQCNTNYTGADENYDHLHLNVLSSYKEAFPNVVVGLSDHTRHNAVVLGAVALGGRVIERHFTDDNERRGPDHAFALDPGAWKSMVADVRLLERALGDERKVVEANERETLVVQRRCIRAAKQVAAGQVIERHHLEVLRPATPGAISPADLELVLGTVAKQEISAGEELNPADLEGFSRQSG